MLIDENKREELVSRITENVIQQLKKHYGPNGQERWAEVWQRNARPLTENEKRLRALREKGLFPLTEASINRILSHGEHGFIVISGNRSELASDDPNLDLTKQCVAELTFILKTMLGMEISDADKQSVQYDGFDYRANELNKIFAPSLKPTNVEAAVNDPKVQDEWLRVRNKWADMALLEDIKKAGYAYSKTFGGYHGTDNVVDSYEPSYIVYNHNRGGSYGNWDSIYNFAIDLCKKYKQGSVYVQAPDEAPVYISGDGEVVSSTSSKNFKINRDKEEFYTTNKRKKNKPQRFTADIQFESMFRGHGPSDYTDRVRRRQSGEVFLD